jgi:hypothetical protein
MSVTSDVSYVDVSDDRDAAEKGAACEQALGEAGRA